MERRTGVTSRMLRYYEQQELLRPGRGANGYREYTESEVEQVVMIRDLSSSGIPTRMIRIILDRRSGRVAWTEACDDILAGLIRDQIADLDARITCLSSSRESLSRFLLSARGAE
ncbi:MerR family transcriptional regulator [Leucobacter weissii]|uniref:MerR family transcriptional regulator n=1 Tax=Leucobacter weissii TaxID=1983706 RepID=A0A939MHZ2_9MICO|nr:MerR family transcriptional regulator [Leucobacter weissii]